MRIRMRIWVFKIRQKIGDIKAKRKRSLQHIISFEAKIAKSTKKTAVLLAALEINYYLYTNKTIRGKAAPLLTIHLIIYGIMMDYIAHNFWLLWTLVCILALIFEVTSGTFYIMCFAIGAAVTVVFSLLGLPFWVQVLIFAAATLASVYAVRPVLLKFLHNKGRSRKSNADALLGRTGVVIEPIENGKPGYVKIDGDEWKAVAQPGHKFDKGQQVKVVGRESIIVTVENI